MLAVDDAPLTTDRGTPLGHQGLVCKCPCDSSPVRMIDIIFGEVQTREYPAGGSDERDTQQQSCSSSDESAATRQAGPQGTGEAPAGIG